MHPKSIPQKIAAWLRLLVQGVSPVIRPIDVGFAVEQCKLFVEVLPRDITDVMGKLTGPSSKRGGPKNDACGYQTLNDAIADAQDVAARLLRYVEPQNLLFLFSESLQALDYASIELPLPPLTPDVGCPGASNGHTQQNAGHDERHPQNRAVILCKLVNADLMQQLRVGIQEHATHDADHQEVTWPQLQAVKQRLDDLRAHSSPLSQN